MSIIHSDQMTIEILHGSAFYRQFKQEMVLSYHSRDGVIYSPKNCRISIFHQLRSIIPDLTPDQIGINVMTTSKETLLLGVPDKIKIEITPEQLYQMMNGALSLEILNHN